MLPVLSCCSSRECTGFKTLGAVAAAHPLALNAVIQVNFNLHDSASASLDTFAMNPSHVANGYSHNFCQPLAPASHPHGHHGKNTLAETPPPITACELHCACTGNVIRPFADTQALQPGTKLEPAAWHPQRWCRAGPTWTAQLHQPTHTPRLKAAH